ncbi:MAG: lysophospholipid acyltransferase family protein [Nanoarchaeota archaeon]|nr:lysophospholipid acyltransferase family protein [Nanoarchaeota archaeon]
MVYPIGGLAKLLFSFPIEELRGLENIPEDGPFILASNHNSFMDPVWLGMSVTKNFKKRRLYFISAMFFLFEFMILGVFSEFFGSIKLQKEIRGAFIRSAITQIDRGNVVGIFPEGIPNNSPLLRKGKTGVARLILHARVPVIPVGIEGSLYVWSKSRLIPRLNKKLRISVGKPMEFSEYYDKKDDSASLETVTSLIMKEIGKLINQDYLF